MKKKLTVVALVVVLVALLISGMTMAYFTDTDSATNVFTIGDVSIDIQEPSWDPGEDDVLENIAPGVLYPKDPKIVNTGKNAAYIRVTITFTNYGSSNTPNPAQFLQDLNKDEKFVQKSSEFVNDDYVIVLESVDALGVGEEWLVFNGVKIPEGMTGDDLKNIVDFVIDIKAEAIQADGFVSADEALAELD